MIPRKLESKLRELAGYYPVVVVTGPRQSGKTTLCQATFPDRPYVSLEALDAREFARGDPRGFLAEYGDGAVFDEIQHVPGLLNYLQGEVDARPDPARFVLTGSQHFGLLQSIAQSLAGRCGILVLLPPSLEELRAFPTAPVDLYSVLWQGAYPRIYDRDIPAHRWLADYTATYYPTRRPRGHQRRRSAGLFRVPETVCRAHGAGDQSVHTRRRCRGVAQHGSRLVVRLILQKPVTSSIACRPGT